jgi:hypothetical protein
MQTVLFIFYGYKSINNLFKTSIEHIYDFKFWEKDAFFVWWVGTWAFGGRLIGLRSLIFLTTFEPLPYHFLLKIPL